MTRYYRYLDHVMRVRVFYRVLGKGGLQKKKTRYLLSLAKKGGRVKAHDQNTKKDKNVVNGGR